MQINYPSFTLMIGENCFTLPWEMFFLPNNSGSGFKNKKMSRQVIATSLPLTKDNQQIKHYHLFIPALS